MPPRSRSSVTALLGNWNTSRTYKPLPVPFKKADPINVENRDARQGERCQFLAGERFKLSQNDPDYPAIVLASYMFGETDHVAHLRSHP